MSKTTIQYGFWHVSNGQLYTSTHTNLVAYANSLRRAYGSLRGVKIIQATSDELAYELAFFGLGACKLKRRENGRFAGFAIVRILDINGEKL